MTAPVRWGFFAQGGLDAEFPARTARLIHAQPLFVKVVDNHSANIGAIRRWTPKGTTFAVLRRYRDQQHLDYPINRAAEHYGMVMEVWDDRYDAATGFNEVGTFNPEQNDRYCDFQQHLAELLWRQGIFYVFDCDSTWYPGWPPGSGLEPEWSWFWERRLEMYRWYQELTGKAVLRCRHEYFAPYFSTPDTERHWVELKWLRAQGLDVDILVGEWGWDEPTPDRGHLSWWEQGISVEEYITQSRRLDQLANVTGGYSAVGRCAFLSEGYGEWRDFDVTSGPGAEALWAGEWDREPLPSYLWTGFAAGSKIERPWYRVRDAQKEGPKVEPEWIGASDFIEGHSNGRVDGMLRDKTHIVLHYTTGGENAFRGTINWFKSPNSKVCTHYVIDRDGVCVQMAKHGWVVYHAGSVEWNSKAIGIEIVNNNKGEPITDAAYATLIRLIRFLESELGIDPVNDVVGHAEIMEGKTDPRGFPWARYEGEFSVGTDWQAKYEELEDDYLVFEKQVAEVFRAFREIAGGL